jgi:nucleoside-diphosphate-sugar epimerase
VVADELAKQLVAEGRSVRLVSRSGHSVQGATALKADVASPDQTREAVRDASVVFLCVGLKYDRRVWAELWPRIMSNTLEGCKRSGSRLIFFDNVYSYGRVDGAMTESAPYNPSSKKGEIRAAIATRLMDEVKSGNIHAMIARAADFYGPHAEKSGIPNVLVFKRLAEGKRPNILASDRTRHSYTFTLDIAGALSALSKSESAFDQVWHLPTAPDPPTGREFVELAAKEFGAGPGYTVLSRWMLKAAGLFDRTIYELDEMIYQNEFDYTFDSSKFREAFGLQPTSYADGLNQTATYYKRTGR